MKILNLGLWLLILIAICFSQDEFGLEWQKCIGGSKDEYLKDMIQLHDSTYIVVGYTKSMDGDITSYYNSWKGITSRLNQDGELMSVKTYGTSDRSWLCSTVQDSDSTILFAGITNSTGTDSPSSIYGCHDGWLLKTTLDGEVIWSKNYGGSLEEYVYKILPTSDGNYVFCGYTYSSDYDCDSSFGEKDGWIAKVDPEGEVIWSNQFGGRRDDILVNFTEMEDGNLIFVGNTNSNDGHLSGNHGVSDTWVVKLNPDGNLFWSRCYGGNWADYFLSITDIGNNEILAIGNTESYDYDIPYEGDVPSYRQTKAWIAKIDSMGNIIDSKLYGTGAYLITNDIVYVSDDVIYAFGYGISTESPIPVRHEERDFLVFRINSNLTFKGHHSYGGSHREYCEKGLLCFDGGILLGGVTRTNNDGDVSGFHYDSLDLRYDIWIVKTEPNLEIEETNIIPDIFSIKCFPNPFNSSINIQFGQYIKNCSIYTIDGREVFSSSVHNTDLLWQPNPQLESGIYLLKVDSEKNNYTKKLIYIK